MITCRFDVSNTYCINGTTRPTKSKEWRSTEVRSSRVAAYNSPAIAPRSRSLLCVVVMDDPVALDLD